MRIASLALLIGSWLLAVILATSNYQPHDELRMATAGISALVGIGLALLARP